MAGLLVTYVALNLMDGHGQPALLYIVPFTLGNSFSHKKKGKQPENANWFNIYFTLMQELFWRWGRKEGISESYGPKENQKHHVPMSVSNIVKNWTRKNKTPCVIIFVVFCSLLLIHGEAGGEKAARQE